MYLNIPSAAMIGLSNRGSELNELMTVAPIDCLSLFSSSLTKVLESPWKSVILRCGMAILS